MFEIDKSRLRQVEPGWLQRSIQKANAMTEATGTPSTPALDKPTPEAEAVARLLADLKQFEHHAVGSLRIGVDEVRTIIAALSTLPQAGEPSPAQPVAWPEKWSGPCTVGNMIANLATLPADMPIHTAYHIVRDGQSSILRVKRPTLSRERCDGITIKTGDEAVPYSAVIWAHPREPEAYHPAPTQPDAGALREAVARIIEPFAWSINDVRPDLLAADQRLKRSVKPEQAVKSSLEKAAAILALTGTQQAKGEG